MLSAQGRDSEVSLSCKPLPRHRISVIFKVISWSPAILTSNCRAFDEGATITYDYVLGWTRPWHDLPVTNRTLPMNVIDSRRLSRAYRENPRSCEVVGGSKMTKHKIYSVNIKFVQTVQMVSHYGNANIFS